MSNDMTTPDWPERRVLTVECGKPRWVNEPYVLALERRYEIAVEALVLIDEHTHDTAARDVCRETLAQCLPLPEKTT